MSVCPFCETEADWPDDIVVAYTGRPVEPVPYNWPIDATGEFETGSWKDPENRLPLAPAPARRHVRPPAVSVGAAASVDAAVSTVAGAATGMAFALHGVSLAYGGDPDRHVVLEGFDAAVPAGAITVLTGPSGAGKSTVLHLLAGILTPDAGTIERPGDVSGGL